MSWKDRGTVIKNLTIGITYTAPGGAPPMHSAPGRGIARALDGAEDLYALGDKLFVKEGPYIVNIPPGVPHSFQNLTTRSRSFVVIFPTNVWEYDVLTISRSTPPGRARRWPRSATAGRRKLLMISGVHAMFYSSKADELRDFIKDKLQLPLHRRRRGLADLRPEGGRRRLPSDRRRSRLQGRTTSRSTATISKRRSRS